MILIDIPMPENCEDCYFNIVGFCHFNNRRIENVLIRPDWCPMKERRHSEKPPIINTEFQGTSISSVWIDDGLTEGSDDD